jgi:hypothetical protein
MGGPRNAAWEVSGLAFLRPVCPVSGTQFGEPAQGAALLPEAIAHHSESLTGGPEGTQTPS